MLCYIINIPWPKLSINNSFLIFRQFVPLSQKLQFDAILNNHTSHNETTPTTPPDGGVASALPAPPPLAPTTTTGSDTAATTTIGNGAFTIPSSHDSLPKMFKNNSLPKYTNNSSGDGKRLEKELLYYSFIFLLPLLIVSSRLHSIPYYNMYQDATKMMQLRYTCIFNIFNIV